MTAPFASLRVLDTTTTIAGAYAGKLLADAGADVVKCEPPGGDPVRRFSASRQPLADGEDGKLFHFLAAGKRSMRIDLDTPAGRERLTELAESADLLIEDTRRDSPSSRGLGIDTLGQRAPRLSVVSISPWGNTGPWVGRPATEFTLQAAVGSTAYRGLPERNPIAAGGQIGEWAAGAYAAVAGLIAFLGSRRTGRGQLADVSMFEVTTIALTVYHDLMGQWNEGPLGRSIETPSIEPTKDGWVGLTTYTGQQWKDFCLMLGRPEVAEDDQYFDARARMEHLEFIRGVIHGFTREHTTDEIIELAGALRIPAAPIGNGQTVLEMDHFRERGVFLDNPAGFKQPRRPYRLSASGESPLRPAPELGEHDAKSGSPWPARPEPQAPDGATAPLEGLRVIDLTAFWAGPVTTATLAEFGADVVKIESIQRPDGMRFAGAVRIDPMWERSPVFHGANSGKRAITLDLDSDEGKQLFLRLIDTADVLVENFSARVMDHFGFQWEKLHARNPRLVMLRMPAWGLDGPWRDRVGFAANVEQVSGLAWLTGYRDMPLIVRGVCDPVGGMHALVGLFAALEERRTTGEGQLVECALAEPALNLAAEQVIEWSAHGELLTRDENRGPAAAPQGCYRTAGAAAQDRESSPDEPWVAIAVTDDAQWQGLLRALGRPGWALDPALASDEGRRARHDEIDKQLSEWAAGRSSQEAAEALNAEGVPASPLRNAHFLMPNTQLAHRGFFRTLDHPVTGSTRYPRFPARLSGVSDRDAPRPAPTLGQHNAEVLGGELGLDDAELDRLREAKVIGDKPGFELP